MNVLDVVYLVVGAATAPFWARKQRGGWGERFGKTGALTPREDEGLGRVLLHGVSVGEVNALRHLVPLLAREARVIVSATTDTGLARARQLYGETCDVVRYPLDASFAVKRFLDAVRPDVVGLVELELWPNFVRACEDRGVPVCVINGRLSERSFSGYRKIRRWMAPVFGRLAFAAVQDEDYARRFEAMGVAPTDCLVTGSMKWDAAEIVDEIEGAGALAEAMGIDRSLPLIVAGSTGPGEEALLHAACPDGVQLLCAPRKPERFDEAAGALPGCVRRSCVSGEGGVGLDGERAPSVIVEDSNDTSPAETPLCRRGRRHLSPQTGREGAGGEAPSVKLADSFDTSPARAGEGGETRFLLDTIGELRAAYSLADLVVVGRSFGDLYGSDPIEPAALEKACVIGPAVSDFAQIVGALESAGGIVRATRESLRDVLAALMADDGRRREIGERGRGCVRAQQGASARHAELVLSLVKSSDGENLVTPGCGARATG